MSLTRTIPARPGLRELLAFGCMFCRVWVTEPKDGSLGIDALAQASAY